MTNALDELRMHEHPTHRGVSPQDRPARALEQRKTAGSKLSASGNELVRRRRRQQQNVAQRRSRVRAGLAGLGTS